MSNARNRRNRLLAAIHCLAILGTFSTIGRGDEVSPVAGGKAIRLASSLKSSDSAVQQAKHQVTPDQPPGTELLQEPAPEPATTAPAATDPAPTVPAHPAGGRVVYEEAADEACEFFDPYHGGQACFDSCAPLREEPCCTPIPCCWDDRGWIRVEWLSWWMQGANAPALITTGAPGTPLAQAGIIGVPGTQVLYGNQPTGTGQRNGARISGGWWFDACHDKGIMFDWFILGRESENYYVDSTTTPILARPFFNTQTGANGRQIDAYPGVLSGSKSVNTTSDLVGFGPSMMCNLCQCCWCCQSPCDDCGGAFSYRKTHRLDLTYGYRFMRLDEDSTVGETLEVLDPIPLNIPVAVGTTLAVSDTFRTESSFQGGEIGLISARTWGDFSLNLVGRIAIGNTHQKLSINGSTIVTVPGQNPVANPIGLLALPTNIGTFTRDRFSIIPFIGAQAGYNLTPRLRATLGYDLMWWTNVLRAVEQIDPVINPNNFTQAPPIQGAQRPMPLFKNDDIWLMGLSTGIQYTF